MTRREVAEPSLEADTIAALATARGTAALAVIRVSGPRALEVVASRFSDGGLEDADGRTVWVGWLRDGGYRVIDQVVCVVWRGPRSSTGEDVVEVTCHGGDVVAGAVLRSLFGAGARPARPGEFTQRAFLNGKLDLAQAEAVADLIHAESTVGHRAAVSALGGTVSEVVADIRESLVGTAALVELELDFAEEDVELADRATLRARLGDADRMLAELVGTARLGALARDGLRVVIGGRPNAGKSTLLNALVGEDRAIVSPTAGTTRDAVEAAVELGGLRVRFLDTAGLRETADAIEAEGTRRARAAIDRADILLYVFDATLGLDAEEHAFLEALPPDRPVVLVANKSDLEAATDAETRGVSGRVLEAALRVSAHAALEDASALDGVRVAILKAVQAGGLEVAAAGGVFVNERHRAHLEAAREAVRRACAALEVGSGGDTLALDLRAAMRELGMVTGAVTTEHVLDAVFSQFCIGK